MWIISQNKVLCMLKKQILSYMSPGILLILQGNVLDSIRHVSGILRFYDYVGITRKVLNDDHHHVQ